MRWIFPILVLALTACAANPRRPQPVIPAAADFAQVAGFRIEKIGITSPVVHLYIETKAAGKVAFRRFEKLHFRSSAGNYLHISDGWSGYGDAVIAFSGADARALLAACTSPAALLDAQRYDVIGDNSNEWVKDRLKEAGLWQRSKALIPEGAISE